MNTEMRIWVTRCAVSGLIALAVAALVVPGVWAVGALLSHDYLADALPKLVKNAPGWLPGPVERLAGWGAWGAWLLVSGFLARHIFKTRSARIAFFLLPPAPTDWFVPYDGPLEPLVRLPWVDPPRAATPAVVDPATGLTERSLTGRPGWEAQGLALGALETWLVRGVGSGRWGWIWPARPDTKNQPGWEPLTLALLTGPNGVGKSALAGHFARQAGRVRGGTEGTNLDDAAKGRRLRASAGAWLRTVCPFLARRAGDPWDVRTLQPSDASQIDALKAWEPCRPTLIVLDEPDGHTTRALEALETRRRQFWHPVRVLLVDQAFPTALDRHQPLPGALAPAVPLTWAPALQLGDVALDSGAARAIWGSVCSAASATGAEPAAQQRNQDLARKLWGSEDVARLLRLSGGNPVQLVLAMKELAASPLPAAAWMDGLTPRENNEPLFDLLDAGVAQRTLLDRRAEDLASGFERILTARAAADRQAVMDHLALATLTGGLALPPELARRLPAGLLAELFPGSSWGATGRPWLPPVRPTAVARAFLRRHLNARMLPDEAAQDLAQRAWQLDPEGALQALQNRAHLPDRLQSALLQSSYDAGLRLPVARAHCLLALQSAQPDPAQPWRGALDAIDALPEADLAALLPWLLAQLAPQAPRAAQALPALTLLAEVAARALASTATLPEPAGRLAAWANTAATLARWSMLAGDTNHHPPTTRRALARASARLLQCACEQELPLNSASVLAWLHPREARGPEFGLTCSQVLVRAGRRTFTVVAPDPEPSPNLATAHLWALAAGTASRRRDKRGLQLAQALAERVDAIAAPPAFAGHAGLQQERAAAWQHAAYAASALGGERALTLAQTLAERVEAIAAPPAFASHAGLQVERATAWRYATYAASVLGGERALTLAQTLAERVEAIAAPLAFASHAGLQEQRAVAWCNAAYAAHTKDAASELGGDRALTLAQALAERVEAIAAPPAFAGHAGLQEQRATAWCFASHVACELGGERALTLSQALAERVEAIAAPPVFASHARLQEERAAAWRRSAHAASGLGGERALTLAQALAERVEAIAAPPAFAGHAGLQVERVAAWRHAADAAGVLGGERALMLAQALVERVEAIAAPLAFAGHAGLQEERANAWRSAAMAACRLGGERALTLAQARAKRVEAIAEPLAFASHAGLQKQRAAAWRYAVHAACRLGGERALTLTQALAERVEAIAAPPAFASHAGLQVERAIVWRNAAYAAGGLGGERALTLAQALAERVEAIAAPPAFASHAGLQEERATAWRYATYAASELDGERALTLTQALAEQVEAIAAPLAFASHAGLQEERANAWRLVTQAAASVGASSPSARESATAAAARVYRLRHAQDWPDPTPFDREWAEAQRALATFGISYVGQQALHFDGERPRPSPAGPPQEGGMPV